MALLVNYEGTYQPPQKLWYLVDGVWAEVKQVFESSAQNELALVDQERIKQDQVVNALQTKIVELQAKLDGSDITIPIETDPVKIETLQKEINLINLQLDVAKTEQVVMTKWLFEQKAQLEYIKLVGEGEKALAKIASLVTNPVEWLCIRVAPQSTLDERLDLVIEHGLEDNQRIFNYGLVYYRLIKVNSELNIDNIEYLKNEFKRRLSKTAYETGIEAINHIFTVDSIQNVYTEVNQFVNSGAKRIEDYLASIKDQQKFILDAIEKAKESMQELEQAAEDGLLTKTEDGKILTKSTLENLQVPLGSKLLSYQNVESFDQLVSTQVLNDIAAGNKDINDYPGIQKLNTDATALNEKIQAIQEFQEINSTIVNDLASGAISFNLNVLTSKKHRLNVSKNLFWQSPLGDSTVANSGGQISYTQTYTSSGTYKFKNDELVTLSTTYTAIINGLLANTKPGTLGVTFSAGEHPKIIQIIDGYLYVYGEESPVIPKVDQKAIINALEANTKEIDISENIGRNEKEQPHTSIVFVKENNTKTTDPNMLLSVYHPVINSLFYPNTQEINLSPNIKVDTPAFEYAFNIRQIPTLETNPASISESFSFNTFEIPLTDLFINNDNIITQITEEIKENSFSFNTFATPLDSFLNNDNIITQVKEHLDEWNGSLLLFNSSLEPLPAISFKNDNVVEQLVSEADLVPVLINFNTSKVNSYERIKNGYGTLDIGFSNGVLPEAPGLTLISYNFSEQNKELVSESEPFEKWYQEFNHLDKPIWSSLELGQKTRVLLSVQTGLMIHEFSYPDDTLNKLAESVPRMLTAENIRIHTPSSMTETLNSLKDPYDAVARISTVTNVKETNLNIPEIPGAVETLYSTAANKLNSLNQDTAHVAVLSPLTEKATYIEDYSSELLNKDLSSIQVPALQLNPGVSIL